MATAYLGEHLYIGYIGQIGILIAFVSAILSAFSYALSSKDFDSGWHQLGRWAFYVHGASIFVLISVLFYAMYHHFYEYAYVFDHVSDDLPLRYILSAFWEGQEGSFLLWMFWNVSLGFILLHKPKNFEVPVILVFALMQVFLTSMILGIYLPIGTEGFKIGSNPFVLLRQINEAPIFQNADYLSLIKGRGLNPLLQNYWMTIHPPITFLGFSSTIVPFAFAFSGLYSRDLKSWIEASYNWVLFSAGILGTGILMGSLWAYEALTFGGYWAWDPVENTSLVAWIVLIGGIHLHLITKKTGRQSKLLYLFYILAFVLILYSTYLTRSGILGDTSAHAFTNMGLESQLIALCLFFLIFGLFWWIKRFKSFDKQTEESVYSREFWLYISALILLLSATLIIMATSLPVFNKIIAAFNPNYTGRVITDPIYHYNKYQLWVAVVVSIISAKAVHLRYFASNWTLIKKKFLLRIFVYSVLAIILTWMFSLEISYFHWQNALLSFSAFFTIVSNGHYVISKLKQDTKLAFAGISHFGFGLMIVGILGSALNQKHISSNPFLFGEVFTKKDVTKYVQLIKGRPLFSQNYWITYESDTLIGKTLTYSIDFKEVGADKNVLNEFKLHPNAVYSNDLSKIAAFNPDTKHEWTRDVFSAVVSVPPAVESIEKSKEIEGALVYNKLTIPISDSIFLEDSIVLKPLTIHYEPSNVVYNRHEHVAGLGVSIKIHDLASDTSFVVEPAFGIDGALLYNYPVQVQDLGLKIRLNEDNASSYFSEDAKLDYQEYKVKEGQSFKIGDSEVKLVGLNKNPKHKNYTSQEGDIAIAAILKIKRNNIEEVAEPIFIIRDNLPQSIKYFLPTLGLHIRLSFIDPVNETFTFQIAEDINNLKNITLDIAKNVPRTDYVILLATVFPAIKLFWLGGIMMMLGLFLSSFSRHFLKRKIS
ncbi:MAG: cytochrome c biogenesis protein CcsA [Lewinellaceae bacterium]|nr:cytochrome c biogenesis protein CcsA [Lewinellaceae bacterium]